MSCWEESRLLRKGKRAKTVLYKHHITLSHAYQTQRHNDYQLNIPSNQTMYEVSPACNQIIYLDTEMSSHVHLTSRNLCKWDVWEVCQLTVCTTCAQTVVPLLPFRFLNSSFEYLGKVFSAITTRNPKWRTNKHANKNNPSSAVQNQ